MQCTLEIDRFSNFPECHADLKGSFGRFASHNFPAAYDSHTNCSWHIEVEEGQRVQITFHLFSVI